MLELLNAIIVMHDGLAQANSAVGSGGGGGQLPGQSLSAPFTHVCCFNMLVHVLAGDDTMTFEKIDRFRSYSSQIILCNLIGHC